MHSPALTRASGSWGWRILWVLFSLSGAVFAAQPPAGAGPAPVRLDFFFEPGCDECARVSAEVLPDLAMRYSGAYILERHDLNIESNYLSLVAWQDKLRVQDNEPVYLLVDGRVLLCGFDHIQAQIGDALDVALATRAEAAPTPPLPAAAPDRRLLDERMRRFTLLGVVAAGAVDSINPCAIGTLVFFMSLLLVAGVRGAVLLAAGAAFVAACFVTYLALGFGLLRVLQMFVGLAVLRRLLDAAMLAVLAVLAVLSFRDAWRYARSRNPRDVTLQLSDGMKARIHATLRRGVGAPRLALGAAGAGVVVTAIESVCTGQVYVPTLVLVLKTGESPGRALLYLLAYNCMFVLPLIVVVALMLRGMQVQQLIAWSQRNVVVSKVLMGLIFIVMAALIVAL